MNPDRIRVREQRESDFPMMLDYWFRSPPGFIEGMGVDLQKLGTEEAMVKLLSERSRQRVSRFSAVTITLDDEPIGTHSLIPFVENDYGVMHAHICRPEFRGKGIGRVSYLKAAGHFFDHLNLKRIVFQTPMQNRGAIRLKEKLGIRIVGETLIDLSIIRTGTRGLVFELTRDEYRVLVTRSLGGELLRS